MLAPQAVDIHSWNLFNYCFTMFSNLPNHSTTFLSSSSQVVHWSAEIQKNVYDPRKEWPTERPSEWIRARSLNVTAAILVLQNKEAAAMLVYWAKIVGVEFCKHFLLFQYFYISAGLCILPYYKIAFGLIKLFQD